MTQPDQSGLEEAARLRYELSRLRAKRSVRAALLVSGAGSPAALWRTVRGHRETPDWDVIPPWVVARQAHYPHLVVLTTKGTSPFGWVASHLQVTDPGEVRAAGGDILVVDIDDPAEASTGPSIAAAARDAGVCTVGLTTTPNGAESAKEAGFDLVVGITPTGEALAGADFAVAPWVNAAIDNPIGWDPSGASIRLDRSTPVTHARSTLQALARGQTVVTTDLGPMPEDVPKASTTSEYSGPFDDRGRFRAARHVLTHHECLSRFEAVLRAINIPLRPPPRISVLLATNRPRRVEHAVAQALQQDYSDLEVVLLLHGEGFEDVVHNLPEDPRLRVRAIDGSRLLGDVLNVGLDIASGEMIAKMDDDDFYGPGHLSDLLLAQRYSGADVVGRWANEVYVEASDQTVTQDLDRQERWAHHLPGATMLARGDVLRGVRFRRVGSAVDTHLIRAIHAAGGSAYATHRFGFIRVRHGQGHTHPTRDDRVGAQRPRPGLDLDVLAL